MINPTNAMTQIQPIKTPRGPDMFAKIIKLRSMLIVLASLLAIAAFLSRSLTVPVSADGGATSVIVQLRDDPAAVYKAKTEKAGGQVSAAQLQAYRDGLRVKQDQ
jgi:hypothetical protein